MASFSRGNHCSSRQIAVRLHPCRCRIQQLKVGHFAVVRHYCPEGEIITGEQVALFVRFLFPGYHVAVGFVPAKWRLLYGCHLVFFEPNCLCFPISYTLHHIVKAGTSLCPDVEIFTVGFNHRDNALVERATIHPAVFYFDLIFAQYLIRPFQGFVLLVFHVAVAIAVFNVNREVAD